MSFTIRYKLHLKYLKNYIRCVWNFTHNSENTEGDLCVITIPKYIFINMLTQIHTITLDMVINVSYLKMNAKKNAKM